MYPCDEVGLIIRAADLSCEEHSKTTERKGKLISQMEKIRMDMLHDVMLAIRPGLHSASIRSKQDVRILDLGTGTGIWAIDMAE